MGVLLSRGESDLFEDKVPQRYSDYYIETHAKPGCRRCLERGKLHFDDPSTGEKWTEVCPCVFRKKF